MVGLVMLLLLAVGVWLFRDRIREAWREFRGGEQAAVATPELAAQAAARLDSLEQGQLQRVALSQVELQSLLQYRYAGLLPAFVDSAMVELDEDRLRLRGRVPVDNLPSLEQLGEAASFLPDTSELSLTGKLLPLDSGRVALGVDQVTVARIPLPRRMVPGALRRLGREPEPGLPDDALPLRLPFGAAAAYIRNDSLVLLTRAPAR